LFSVEVIKILAAIASIAGSAILAYRVTGVLWALGRASEVHDLNIMQLMSPRRDIPLVHFGDITVVVEKAQKKFLIVLGFTLIILSALMQLWALTAELGYVWPYTSK